MAKETHNDSDFPFPVWGTQGGGLVREAGYGKYKFVTDPGCSGLKIGDEMPEEWSLGGAANEMARTQEVSDAIELEAGLEEFFDTVFDKVDSGRMSLGEAGRFFPNRK